ncbi:alpha/beta fold hydrolase [Actinoplanes philippinensis]
MPIAVAEIMAVLPGELTTPYLVFGHSMGGLLGYELARALPVGHRQPTALVLAAVRPPHLVSRAEAREATGEARLRAAVDAELAGTAFAGDDDFADMLLATLRADARLCAEYRHADEPVLSCPVVAWAGQQDQAVTREHMSEWRRYTSGSFRIAEMPGGHHFARTHADRTAAALQDPDLWGVAPSSERAHGRRGNA